MPQLVVEDWAPQLIWLAITFTTLYIIMARVALPRIANVLEERSVKIASDLDDAQRLKQEADDAMAAYEKALADARAKAHAIAAETRDKVNAETDRQQADLSAKLVAKAQEAEARISSERDKALSNVRDVAKDTAAAVVGNLLGNSDEAAVSAAVDAELA